MRSLDRTNRFKKLYQKLPAAIKMKVRRQLRYLAEDIRHPSLCAKKIKGTAGIWEARVDYRHRMTFRILDSRVVLRGVGPHDMLKRP